jgi:CBS domain-containing protein
MQRWSVADVMTVEVVSVGPACGYRQIADLLVSHRISAVPVVAVDGSVIGVVSEADLLEKLEYADARPRHPLVARHLPASPRMLGGDTAAALMTAPAVTISAAAPVSTAARVMTAARVKRLPVVDRDDRLVGIVSRHDVLQLFARPDGEVRHSVVHALGALGADVQGLRVEVNAGLVLLCGPVEDEGAAATMTALVASIPGVVDVLDELTRTARPV